MRDSIFVTTSELQASVNARLKHQRSDSVYDVIVIGVGSMGSVACYQLAQQGLSVLGLEQFQILHEMGSHGGQSRIIRKAYFEHPSYVPLLKRAYENWRAIEQASGVQIYFDTGLVYFGPKDHLLIEGSLDSAKQYDIEINEFNSTEREKKYPQFEIPDDFTNMLETEAGFVSPERSILAHIDQALNLNASIHSNEKVISWSSSNGEIRVETENNSYRSKKLVITTGPWTSEITSFDNLQVTRQILAWAYPENEEPFALGEFPCWTYADHTMGGIYYGFPILPNDQFSGPKGLKFAHHTKGTPTDPHIVNRTISKNEQRSLVDSIKSFMPSAIKSISMIKTCLYTYSPDDHFIIDFYNQNPDIVIATGFSGHGFKFASVVGEVISDLIVAGQTDLPIEFFTSHRFK